MGRRQILQTVKVTEAAKQSWSIRRYIIAKSNLIHFFVMPSLMAILFFLKYNLGETGEFH